MRNAEGLRITGGRWRGRRVVCPSGSRMRPTTDLNRQRLFNWLGDKIVGALVLDLFAGSGMLSFESLSRGASGVTMVELDPRVVRHLYQYRDLLGAQREANIITAKLPQRMSRIPSKPYDVIFLDPPFGYDLVLPTCAGLMAGGYLKKDSMVYIECEAKLNISHLLQSDNWQLQFSQVSGEVAQYILSMWVSQ